MGFMDEDESQKAHYHSVMATHMNWITNHIADNNYGKAREICYVAYTWAWALMGKTETPDIKRLKSITDMELLIFEVGKLYFEAGFTAKKSESFADLASKFRKK